MSVKVCSEERWKEGGGVGETGFLLADQIAHQSDLFYGLRANNFPSMLAHVFLAKILSILRN